MKDKHKVTCPGCGEVYPKGLFIWQFIQCFKCKTIFEKHTGKRILCDGFAQALDQKYWMTDAEVRAATSKEAPDDHR